MAGEEEPDFPPPPYLEPPVSRADLQMQPPAWLAAWMAFSNNYVQSYKTMKPIMAEHIQDVKDWQSQLVQQQKEIKRLKADVARLEEENRVLKERPVPPEKIKEIRDELQVKLQVKLQDTLQDTLQEMLSPPSAKVRPGAGIAERVQCLVAC